MKNLPLVAIVGSPNVGKSTLLNKIAGRPMAVTSEVAGTTRDRQYADVAWNDSQFTLVDTAGISVSPTNTAAGTFDLEENVLKQIDIAVAEADMLLLVVDGKAGRVAVEQSIVKKFRRIKKPVILVVNKLDSAVTWEEKSAEFLSIGIKPMFPISSINGRGIGDLLDAIASATKNAGTNTTSLEEQHPGIAVAIVGKPNVGKSSIFNSIIQEERVVVSAMPGTTRTAIDSHIKIGDVNYTFIDTAGLKKKVFRQEQPDVFGGFQTFKAIRRSDVCFLVLDATEEVTKQDQRVAQEIFSQGKGCIVLVNKIDLYSPKTLGNIKRGETGRPIAGPGDNPYQSLQDYVSHHFPFLWMSPVFFVSAKSGRGLEEALAAVKPIFERRKKTIEPEVLQEFLNKKVKQNPPKLLRDQKPPKVFGLKQLDVEPPLFELLVNHPAAISQQFRKFVENGITRELDFYGTPISLKLKGKDKT